MKNIGLGIFVLLSGLMVLVSGCDLELQDAPEIEPNTPPLNIVTDSTGVPLSAWEYITYRESAVETDPFIFTRVAIERAGMEEYYQADSIDDPLAQPTFLIFTNEAWTGNKGILRMFGVQDIPEIPVAQLQNLLKYHIIPERLAQEEMLPTVEKIEVFETLLAPEVEGDSGLVYVYRSDRDDKLVFNDWERGAGPPVFKINNGDGRNTAKSLIQNHSVQHHYQFTNGLGHLLNQQVSNISFKDWE